LVKDYIGTFSRVSFLLPEFKYVEKKIVYFLIFNIHIRIGILHLCANHKKYENRPISSIICGKEKKFYPLYIEQAANIEAAAKLLVELLQEQDPEKQKALYKDIKEYRYEHLPRYIAPSQLTAGSHSSDDTSTFVLQHHE